MNTLVAGHSSQWSERARLVLDQGVPGHARTGLVSADCVPGQCTGQGVAQVKACAEFKRCLQTTEEWINMLG